MRGQTTHKKGKTWAETAHEGKCDLDMLTTIVLLQAFYVLQGFSKQYMDEETSMFCLTDTNRFHYFRLPTYWYLRPAYTVFCS